MTKRRLVAIVAALATAVCVSSCGSSTPSAPTPTTPGGGGTAPAPAPLSSATIIAAGDIGECGFGALETGKLLDRLAGTLLALGDLAYMQGSGANFRDCYDPAWGRHLDRTRPVPGNHEYETSGAASYFDYFGGQAGARGQGYYAFSAGPWRLIALNSEIPMATGSAQLVWLRSELEANRTPCTLAYFHRPLFSSGPNGGNPDVQALYRTLMEFGVDVVLNGHDHLYERFALQDADGKPTPAGIRQFTAGTGGAHLYTPAGAKPNSEVRGSAYGVLSMTLSNNGYAWDFVSVTNSFRDTGSGGCH
jgi:hypothetical protein